MIDLYRTRLRNRTEVTLVGVNVPVEAAREAIRAAFTKQVCGAPNGGPAHDRAACSQCADRVLH
jgi:hypothetical protein